MTCTPVGINTHRLLVRGSRIPYEEAQEIQEEVPAEELPISTWEQQYMNGILFGLIAVAAAGLVTVIVVYVKKVRHG